MRALALLIAVFSFLLVNPCFADVELDDELKGDVEIVYIPNWNIRDIELGDSSDHVKDVLKERKTGYKYDEYMGDVRIGAGFKSNLLFGMDVKFFHKGEDREVIRIVYDLKDKEQVVGIRQFLNFNNYKEKPSMASVYKGLIKKYGKPDLSEHEMMNIKGLDGFWFFSTYENYRMTGEMSKCIESTNRIFESAVDGPESYDGIDSSCGLYLHAHIKPLGDNSRLAGEVTITLVDTTTLLTSYDYIMEELAKMDAIRDQSPYSGNKPH